MAIILHHEQQDLNSYLSQAEKSLQEILAEVTELQEMQKSGAELYVYPDGMLPRREQLGGGKKNGLHFAGILPSNYRIT